MTEQFLSRQDIRSQAFSLAGYSPDLTLSAQDKARIDALIDMASMAVAGKNRWVSLQRRATVGLPQDQTIISYRKIEEARWMEGKYPNQYHPGTFGTTADTWFPSDLATADIANIGPAGILEASVAGTGWSGDTGSVTNTIAGPLGWSGGSRAYSYYPLVKMTQRTRDDTDRWADFTAETQLISVARGDTPAQTQAAVQAADGIRKQNRGRPRSFWPIKDGIQILPIPDAPSDGTLLYVVRVAYTVTPTWQYQYQGFNSQQIDQLPSVVDAQAIIYYVVAKLFAQQGDKDLQMSYMADFEQRIRDLRAQQATDENVCQDDTASFYDNFGYYGNQGLPNWAIGPTVFTR